MLPETVLQPLKKRSVITSGIAELDNPLEHPEFEEPTANMSHFTGLLKPSFFILKLFGFFPIHRTIFHWKNLWSYVVIFIIGCLDLYLMTVRTLPFVTTVASNWSTETSVLIALRLWFYLTFYCLFYVARLGYKKRIAKFDLMLLNATKQDGLAMDRKALKLRFALMLGLMGFIVITVSSFYPLLVLGEFAVTWPAAKILKSTFGKGRILQATCAIFIFFNALVKCMSITIYAACCGCLKCEFQSINREIKDCDFNSENLKSIALRHSRLLECLAYLNDMTPLYSFLMFAVSIVFSIIFAYVIVIDVDIGFRIISVLWLVSSFSIKAVLCISADSVRNAAKEAKERVCTRIAEENSLKDLDLSVHQTATIICQQSSTDIGITALGFFVLSKEALLMTYSFIGTYVVILLKSMAYSSYSVSAQKSNPFSWNMYSIYYDYFNAIKLINMAFSIAVRPPQTETELCNDIESAKELSPPFLRLLRLSIAIHRYAGLFPIEAIVLHEKNLYSYIIITFIGSMCLYSVIFKAAPAIYHMFVQWNVEVTVAFGIGLYFGLSFTCLVFVVSLGYYHKLQRFSELLSHATNQKGLENNFKRVARKLYIVQITVAIAASLNFVIYGCLLSIHSLENFMPVAVDTIKNLFGESWLAYGATLFFAPLDYLVLYQSALLYWTCCKCLRIEFEQVSKEITECDVRDLGHFKAIALKHSRLLKCLAYLHKIVAFYVFCVFAIGSLISTLFAYVILLNVDFGFRLLAGYWLVLTACVNCILCLSAEGLQKAAKQAKEKVCSKIAESSRETYIDNMAYNTANMICQQATIDTGITAFGFFTVSKAILLTIYSLIGTYVVILLQSPPTSADTMKAEFTNTTLH